MVDPLQGAAPRGEVIVVLNLRGRMVAVQAQLLDTKRSAKACQSVSG